MTSFLPKATRSVRTGLLTAVTSLLVACATPSAPVNKTVFDFGEYATPSRKADPVPMLAPLALAEMQTAWGQSSTAMQYRLTYANAQELAPYAQARWSMPPAQLVAQRVRAVLSLQRPVVSLGDSSTNFVLQLTLETFGQNFASPQTSEGVVQWRATLLNGDQLVAQRDFSARAAAPSPDAAGGAKALSEATQTATVELADWVNDHVR